MEVMLTLIRKDWRAFRAPVVATLVLGVAPYALNLLSHVSQAADREQGLGLIGVLRAIDEASIASTACIAVLAGALGGTAWAAERADRSASFLALLPPPRWKLIASKVTVAASWLVACFIADVLVCVGSLHFLGIASGHQSAIPADTLRLLAGIGCYAVMAFGVAWCASTLLDSSAIAAGIGIGAGVALYFWISIRWEWQPFPTAIWAASAVSIGALAFLVGTAICVLRVEP